MAVKFRNAFTNRSTKDFEDLNTTEVLVDTSDYVSITEYCKRFGVLPKPVEVVDGEASADEVETEKDLGDFNYSKPSQEQIDLLNEELKAQEKQERVENVEKSQVVDIATNQQSQVASPSSTSQQD